MLIVFDLFVRAVAIKLASATLPAESLAVNTAFLGVFYGLVINAFCLCLRIFSYSYFCSSWKSISIFLVGSSIKKSTCSDFKSTLNYCIENRFLNIRSICLVSKLMCEKYEVSSNYLKFFKNIKICCDTLWSQITLSMYNAFKISLDFFIWHSGMRWTTLINLYIHLSSKN